MVQLAHWQVPEAQLQGLLEAELQVLVRDNSVRGRGREVSRPYVQLAEQEQGIVVC